MVVTEGDHFAELVAAEELGIVVHAGDVQQLAAAIEKALFDEAFIEHARRNIRRVRERYFWEAALAPLVDFVADARHAGDNRQLGAGSAAAGVRLRGGRPRAKRSGIRHDLGLVVHYLRNGGPRLVARKIRSRLLR